MKIVCIENFWFNSDDKAHYHKLTINKIYDGYLQNFYYTLKNDINEDISVSRYNFITLEELRDIKIDKLEL